ncbi:MAG: hypothetical protein CV090_11370 [Nitrospira sp. WS238]|nr:hypothetical protein [Nitrospira sp. WS238]
MLPAWHWLASMSTYRHRCIACGTAGQVGHIVERRTLIEFPAPLAVAVGGMSGQHGRHLAGAHQTGQMI